MKTTRKAFRLFMEMRRGRYRDVVRSNKMFAFKTIYDSVLRSKQEDHIVNNLTDSQRTELTRLLDIRKELDYLPFGMSVIKRKQENDEKIRDLLGFYYIDA